MAEPTEIWTWPFTEEQQARLSAATCSVDGMQDVFLCGPEAPVLLGMFGPDWAHSFAGGEDGDTWHIAFRRMSLEEINNLPEFEGF